MILHGHREKCQRFEDREANATHCHRVRGVNGRHRYSVMAPGVPVRPNSDPTSGPFPAATGLGFAGFFFPLLKPVLGMGGHPAIRQQSFQGSGVAGGDRRQSDAARR